MTAIGVAVLSDAIALAADGRTVLTDDPVPRPPWAPETVERTVKVLPVLGRFAVAVGGRDYLPDLERFTWSEDGTVVGDTRAQELDPDLLPWWTRAGIVTNAERLRFWEREEPEPADDPEALTQQLCAVFAPPLIAAGMATMPEATDEELGAVWEQRLYVAGWSPERGRGEVWQGWIRVGRPPEHPGVMGAMVGYRELATTDELRVGLFEDWESAAVDTIYDDLDGSTTPQAARTLVDRAVVAQQERDAVSSGGRVLTVAVVRDAAAYDTAAAQ